MGAVIIKSFHYPYFTSGEALFCFLIKFRRYKRFSLLGVFLINIIVNVTIYKMRREIVERLNNEQEYRDLEEMRQDSLRHARDNNIGNENTVSDNNIEGESTEHDNGADGLINDPYYSQSDNIRELKQQVYELKAEQIVSLHSHRESGKSPDHPDVIETTQEYERQMDCINNALNNNDKPEIDPSLVADWKNTLPSLKIEVASKYPDTLDNPDRFYNGSEDEDDHSDNDESRSPLDQFEIDNLLSLDAPVLGDIDLYISNIGLYLAITTFIALVIYLIAKRYNKAIIKNDSKSKSIANNGWRLLSKISIYDTIHSIVISQINRSKGQMYLPFIYALFIFILINNLVGMVPYSFASTAHFILIFFISFTVVLGTTLLGLQKHELKFFSLFVPAGCPLGLLPLLVLIEFISYVARNVSLGLRLAANILSGHMLLNILSGFAYNIMTSGLIYFLIGLIPLVFIIAFSGLELGIAFIQAQVFVVLTSSYIKDALLLH